MASHAVYCLHCIKHIVYHGLTKPRFCPLCRRQIRPEPAEYVLTEMDRRLLRAAKIAAS